MLDKQISMYSVDTGHFYFASERKKHQRIMQYKIARKKLVEGKALLRNHLITSGIITDKKLKEYERFKFPLAEERIKELKDLTDGDGNCIYTNEEINRIKLNTQIEELEAALTSHPFYSLKYIMKNSEKLSELDGEKLLAAYSYFCKAYSLNTKITARKKEELLKELKGKVEMNEETGGKHHKRILNIDELLTKDVINVFDSSVFRTIQKDDELIEKYRHSSTNKETPFTNKMITVKIFFFDVFKDIMKFGFCAMRGRDQSKCSDKNSFIYFTSSAGQIRTKKAVFMRESTWKKHEKTFMCGLTIDKINELGGNVINKHLAYLALGNSATDEWKNVWDIKSKKGQEVQFNINEGFDIDKCIVLDDFETMVSGEFDYIDDVTYKIERITNSVPIPHSDGAGLVLPSVSTKNFMIRLPFVKGLMAVCDFVSFIKEKGGNPIVKDIYGVEHNIIEEDVRMIFTKSQTKLWKFYSSFEEYKENFKRYNCSAGYCNLEENRIKNAHINYQMLQTFTDFSKGDVEELAGKSVEKLRNITSSKESMLEVFGVTKYNYHKNPLQKALSIYPNLLNDPYLKETIKDIKNSMKKKYRAGHLEVRGKYTFILPDVYAMCQHYFLGEEVPSGLLNDGEVYCRLFKGDEKLDCLRSPHLYKEHAVQLNTACSRVSGDRLDELKKWFVTDGLYTSTYSMISRILQFDDLL